MTRSLPPPTVTVFVKKDRERENGGERQREFIYAFGKKKKAMRKRGGNKAQVTLADRETVCQY